MSLKNVCEKWRECDVRGCADTYLPCSMAVRRPVKMRGEEKNGSQGYGSGCIDVV